MHVWIKDCGSDSPSKYVSFELAKNAFASSFSSELYESKFFVKTSFLLEPRRKVFHNKKLNILIILNALPVTIPYQNKKSTRYFYINRDLVNNLFWLHFNILAIT